MRRLTPSRTAESEPELAMAVNGHAFCCSWWNPRLSTGIRCPVGEEAFTWRMHHVQGQPVVSWHGFGEEIMRQAVEQQLLERSH